MNREFLAFSVASLVAVAAGYAALQAQAETQSAEVNSAETTSVASTRQLLESILESDAEQLPIPVYDQARIATFSSSARPNMERLRVGTLRRRLSNCEVVSIISSGDESAKFSVDCRGSDRTQESTVVYRDGMLMIIYLFMPPVIMVTNPQT